MQLHTKYMQQEARRFPCSNVVCCQFGRTHQRCSHQGTCGYRCQEGTDHVRNCCVHVQWTVMLECGMCTCTEQYCQSLLGGHAASIIQVFGSDRGKARKAQALTEEVKALSSAEVAANEEYDRVRVRNVEVRGCFTAIRFVMHLAFLTVPHFICSVVADSSRRQRSRSARRTYHALHCVCTGACQMARGASRGICADAERPRQCAARIQQTLSERLAGSCG